ncbi:MAG: hypothetical protein AABZ06_02130 [Bdellovibrionota bacterium]
MWDVWDKRNLLKQIYGLCIVIGVLSAHQAGAIEMRGLQIKSQKEQAVCFKVSNVHRARITYGDDGNVASIGCTHGELSADGPYAAFYPDGHLKTQGSYKRNALDGAWTRWRRNGKLLDRGQWRNSIPHGQWFFYDNSGRLSGTAVYENGRRIQSSGNIRAKQGPLQPLQGAEAHAPIPAAPRFSVTPSLGISFNLLTEGATNYHLIALTAKASMQYSLSRSFSIGANSFITAQSLSTNLPDMRVRYFGANIRFGYAIPWITSPWSLSIATGLSYGRMFVEPGRFGYGDLLYPQIYPSIRRRIDTGAVYAYLKCVPLGDAITDFSMNAREIAFGGGYEIGGTKPWHPVLSVDVSDLIFIPSNAATPIRSASITLGLGVTI